MLSYRDSRLRRKRKRQRGAATPTSFIPRQLFYLTLIGQLTTCQVLQAKSLSWYVAVSSLRQFVTRAYNRNGKSLFEAVPTLHHTPSVVS